MRRQPEHVVFVHAHPDDETISTGGTIASLVEAGVGVTVITCTRGERGEVIPPELHHLEGDGPALAVVRERELAAAMSALGVTDHRYLGGADARAAGLPPRAYSDSGMVWGADGRPEPVPELDAHSLCSAPFEEVVADIAHVIAGVGADAVVSYDENGGYGHPDHMLAHRAARSAASLEGVPFHEAIEDAEALARLEASAAIADDVTLLDVTPVLAAKVAAMRAHATQISVIEREGQPVAFALSNGRERPVGTREGFRLVEPDASPDSGDPQPQTRTSRVSSALVSFIIGALIGVLLTINHQHRLTLGAVTVPLGLIICLLVVAAVLVGMRLVFSSRMVAGSTALGIAGATALLSQEGPGGSVLVPANTEGFVWAYAPLLIALVVLAWPRMPSPGRARMESQHRQEGASP